MTRHPEPVAASWTRRTAATVIDLTLLWVIPSTVYATGAYVAADWWARTGRSPETYLTLMRIWGWVLILIQLAYLIGSEARIGQTYGKRLARVAITETGSEQPPGWRRAAARRAAQITLPLWPAQALYTALRGRESPPAPHDRLSHTRAILAAQGRRAPWRYLHDLIRPNP